MATKPAKVQIPVTEDDVQAVIVGALQLHGYEVLVTSRRRMLASCPKCSQRFRPTGGDGASKGVPDLLVTKKTWPHWLWVGMEVKGPKTAVSPEQQDLADRGRVTIVRSMDDALAAVRFVDNTLKSLAGGVA